MRYPGKFASHMWWWFRLCRWGHNPVAKLCWDFCAFKEPELFLELYLDIDFRLFLNENRCSPLICYCFSPNNYFWELVFHDFSSLGLPIPRANTFRPFWELCTTLTIKTSYLFSTRLRCIAPKKLSIFYLSYCVSKEMNTSITWDKRGRKKIISANK